MGAQFPELAAQQTLIERVIEEEEASFLRTLSTGISLLDGVIAKAEGGKISGKDAFVLYDTFGFPIDLTELIAREQGVDVDIEAFEQELQRQKERSRNAASQDIDDWQELLPIDSSEFIGYDALSSEVRIARYRRVKSKGKTTYQLVFDRTPFYGNSGGQIGDTGFIDNGSERIAVVATEKENGLIIHITERLPEDLAAVFRAQVDPARRQSAANNHTATHLLDYALKQVLGEHVEQKGSMVTPDYLRFDFSHFQKVTPEQLREVEKKVNAMIRSNHPLVERRDATIEQAREAGAIMLFGEKYGDRVRMVTFGPSTELCGGTHTSATGTIGLFKIVSESAISAGVRRIEAVTGEGAERILYTVQDTMQSIEQMLHSPRLVQTIEKILEGNDALSRELDEMRREKIVELADKIVAEASCTHDVLTIEAEANSFATKHHINGTASARRINEVDSIIRVVRPDDETGMTNLKRQLADFITADTTAIVSYYIINKSLGDKAIFNPSDAFDNRIYGAAAQVFANFRPNDARGKTLTQAYFEGRRALGKETLPAMQTIELPEQGLIDIVRYDSRGNRHSLSELAAKGKPVVLSFTSYDLDPSPAYNIALNEVYSKIS